MSETQDESRDRQIRQAREAMPGLEAMAEALAVLTRRLMKDPIPYPDEDSAAIMIISFVAKQYEHLHSVRVLVRHGCHRDAYLLSRTSMEGMARLLWALNDKPARTDLWMWFGAIQDWRRTLRNEADGIVMNHQAKADLKVLVDKHGQNYYRPKVEQAIEESAKSGVPYAIPDDPWGNDWTRTSIETMFQQVNGAKLYQGRYRLQSEWIHWSPRGILSAVEPSQWGVGLFTDDDWRAAAEALQLSIQSLLQTVSVLNDHFDLQEQEEIERIYEWKVRPDKQ